LPLPSLNKFKINLKGGQKMAKAEIKKQAKPMDTIEYVGLGLLGLAILGILFIPDKIAGVFDAMVAKAWGMFGTYIFERNLGAAIITSVIVGRVLERLGFTDALMRIFVPIMRIIGVNSAVVVPGVYNILGDVNAAGRISGPVLAKAGATKDEVKIAIATMVQAPCSFSIVMLGMLAMSIAGIKIFPVMLFTLFLPLVLIPLLLRLTIWKNTKPVELIDLPRFTPSTPFIPTLFNAAREGAELVFLLILPAAALVFGIIGALEYLGIWQHVGGWITTMLTALNIEPNTGTVTILSSGTLAMSQMVELVKTSTVAKGLLVGSWTLANSGFPLQVPFAQIPAVWAANTELNEKEAMGAAVLGCIIRLIYAALSAIILAPIV